MAQRTLSSVAPTANTIALNAFIFGYAGHSMVTPHATLKQIWWTAERINAKVTREFVTSRLGVDEQARLHRPLAFDGLTDDTYLDWVLEKAQRLFLILADIGAAAQIYKVVDEAWDDGDLPLSMSDIKTLGLESARLKGVAADQAFYDMQFTYLLREVQKGEHIDYEEAEIVPLELVMKLPPAVSLQSWERVHYPGKPDEIYVRRQVRFGSAHTAAIKKEFVADVETSHTLAHPHIAPVWASYTQKDCGYVLSNFVAEHTLRSFIEHRMPLAYEKLPVDERLATVLTWMVCLSDALAHLHRDACVHSAIRPSNILIDASCKICFKDIGTLRTLQNDRKRDAQEEYIYGSPEEYLEKAPPSSQSPESEISLSPLSRTASISTTAQSVYSLSLFPTPPNHTSFSLPTSSVASAYRSSSVSRSTDPPPTPSSQTTRSSLSTIVPPPDPVTIASKSDIFSLGCIFHDILTFLLKHKPAEALKQRSSKAAIAPTSPTTSRKKPTPKIVTDASFHGNLAKVGVWLETLEQAAAQQSLQIQKQKQKQKLKQKEKEKQKYSLDADASLMQAAPLLLSLTRDMLSSSPYLRPAAEEVTLRVRAVLEWAGFEIACGCAAGSGMVGEGF